MKRYFFMLLGIVMITISCTKENNTSNDSNKQDIPELLFGTWIYTNNDNEDYYFCQGISFNSSSGYWQISQQEYNDLSMCGGTMTYDVNSHTIYLNCKLEHEHLRMNGVQVRTIKIVNLTDEKLIVHIAGKTIEYYRNNESYIIPHYVWTNGSDEKLNPEGKVPSPNDYGVDLGLSVYWAEYNVGSTESTEIGGCYGWGDVTGTYYTEDDTKYPSANPPSDISGTEYDIASYKWGNGWRIPTKEEMEELVDNCYITWHNWCKCWEYISKINGNSIKLPYAPVRSGKSTFHNECGYWTSTLDRTYMGAYALYTLKSGGNLKYIDHFKRSYGQQIRPVKDKRDTDLQKNILGSWSVLTDDPTWKVIIQFKANGVCEGTDWYDIEGDETFLEKEGTWEGTYTLNTDKLTITANSVLEGVYTLTSVSSNYFEATAEDGFKIYATRK